MRSPCVVNVAQFHGEFFVQKRKVQRSVVFALDKSQRSVVSYGQKAQQTVVADAH